VRVVERALGNGIKRPFPAEADTRTVARRSLAARADIPAGTVLQAAMLTALRPASGIPATLIGHVIGRRTRHPLAAGQFIDWSDLE
jgi:N,N'-diacetyllegionaminate synthase